jgi:ATP/maltotriose-dependent transcriptional regulator MalT
MSDFPVLRTKITPPYRRDELLARERLIELFDDLLEKKLVIVTAPAGYGKTSLLVDLAHRHELPYCWYTLDPLDKELGRFLTYFVAAIQLQYPQFGAQSMAALQYMVGADLSDRPGEVSPGERFLVTLVNELYQTIREHFAIVLDDYHNLDDNQEINAFISRFVQEVDQNCHLVILSRTLLPLPDLPLMVARSQVGGIGMQELAFRADEIQALMLQNYQQAIPPKVAAELAQRTEGWITGLLLSTQSMWQGMLDRLRVARVSGVGLYDYLVHQVLEQQPPELQDFLLKSAYLEEFNAEICADLIYNLSITERCDALWKCIAPEPTRQQMQAMQALAQMALNRNLFVTPVGEDGSWLRYHPLFREFLQNHLKQEQPETARRVLYSLVRIYSQRGEWERAYAACQRLDDPAATAGLLEQAARTMLTGGRISEYQRWLDALPPGTLESRPVLLARHGLVLATQGETARGLHHLDQALERYQAGASGVETQNIASLQSNDHNLQLAWIYLWRALVHQIRGSYAKALDDASAALALVERDGEAGSADNVTQNAVAQSAVAQDALEYTWPRSEAYRIRGVCQRQLGRVDEAIRNFSTSLSLYQAQGNSKSVNLVLMNLGAAYLDAAEFGSALSCYKRALDYYQPQNDAFSLSSVLNDVAFLYHLRGEYALAFTTFEEALARASQGANLRVQALALIGMGDLHQDLQALDSALDSYHQARPITEQINDRYLMIYLDLAEAAMARLKEDFASARLLLNAASQISQQSPSDYFRSLHQMESGRLALAEQDYALAANVLGQAAAGFQAGGQRVEAGRARLLLAAACFELGDLPAAGAHLEEMFQLVDRWENQHSLVPTARQVRPFLQQVAALAAATPAGSLKLFGADGASDPLLGRKALRLLDQVDRLESSLAHLQRRLRRQSSIVAPSPPHLQIHALGKAEVLLRLTARVKPEAGSSRNSGRKSAAPQLTSADWQTQVTRDLFFLILTDPRGWTKEALGELLWPGSSPAQLKLRFKNTIYRLRRALQQDAILFEGDRYTFNRTLDYEYDVEQFWEQLNQAAENATPRKKIKALQAAMQIYQGDYLPEVSGAWVLPEQARLRQAFLDAGLQLARLYIGTGQPDQALEVANRLIAADSCLEDAYVTAMQAQAAAGNRPSVARLYEKLSQTLLQELGASPSPQTESLYLSLKD